MIVFKAKKNVLSVEGSVEITSGSISIYTCQFEFSSDWDGLSRTAVFYAGEVKKSAVLDSDNRCQIPWEVLEIPVRQLYAGVYGTRDGTIVLPTTWVCLGEIQKGAIPGEASEEPTPGAYDQIAGIAQQLLEDADSGRFDGTDGITPHIGENGNWWLGNADTGKPSRGVAGPQGQEGPVGPQGEEGVTPHIGENGNWWIGPEDTGMPSQSSSNAIICDASGNPVHIVDSSKQLIRNLTIYGKSTQDGTPSPENPVEIVSVGDTGSLVITASDDGTNSIAASLSNNSHPDNPIFPLRGIPVSSGGNVTINGQQYIADTLEVNADGTGNVVKRCEKYIVTGQENWKYLTEQNRYDVRLSGIAGANTYYCMTPYFGQGSGGTTLNNVTWVNSDVSRGLELRIKSSLFEDDNELKTWLQNKYASTIPMYFIYSKTPEVIPLTSEAVQALLALRTYKPVTNVSNDGGAWQTVTYVADTKNYIDSKFAQLAAQIVANA